PLTRAADGAAEHAEIGAESGRGHFSTRSRGCQRRSGHARAHARGLRRGVRLAQDAARSPPLRACALPIGPGSSEISFLMSDLERATPTSPPESRARRLAAWAANLCQALRDYFGSGGRRRLEPV